MSNANGSKHSLNRSSASCSIVPRGVYVPRLHRIGLPNLQHWHVHSLMYPMKLQTRSRLRLTNEREIETIMKLIFATRPSALARWQTQWVIQALKAFHPNLVCEEKVITTQGDKILDRPLPEIGGKGLFTQELENELLSGAVHCAVHSLKDLPVETLEGLTIGCVPVRA